MTVAPERGAYTERFSPGVAGVSAVVRGGLGSPAGVVAEAVGSLYLRVDGGTNTTLYVKETGGSTTSGWVAR